MEAAAAATPVSAQVVGNAFVQQYYHILHYSPGLVFRFYQDISKLGRPEDDGSMSTTTMMQAINDKILSLNYGDFKAEIQSVDSQESFNGGVLVLVTGYLTGEGNLIRNFSQTFFLAPQDRGYFVLNDMFRYVESVNQHDTARVPATDAVAPVTPEHDPLPVQQNHVPEQSIPSVEEANGEVYNSLENGDVPVEEEVPVAEVVDEIEDDSQVVVESNIKSEDVPKKSYASIVMHLKGDAASFSPPPAPGSRKPMAKSVEQVNQPPITATDRPASSSNSVDNANNQEGEATDGYSIYIKGLPPTATIALLADEFKKFGPIKSGGIQVKNNREHGYSFGFVEFEEASAMQKAIEASPILIGGRQAVVEEKKSTDSRGNFRGRFFPSGRGYGYRNDGVRGRGNYGGSCRGYARGDFGGRIEFNNRGGHRGWSSNRGGDGYQRTDNQGGYVARINCGGGMPNGNFATPEMK
ncbi:hypothetical protein K7X08_020414 [Anisodus acutangulus]|uniref:G3BP-like protein n=1 Tax=Anisodus acutangulus TaxID=402998 RepID=A0A9Q1M705_9SOLA|nr:hypothetical protein K7X08_020414 [Anisodus acutangulus]